MIIFDKAYRAFPRGDDWFTVFSNIDGEYIGPFVQAVAEVSTEEELILFDPFKTNGDIFTREPFVVIKNKWVKFYSIDEEQPNNI